MHAFKVIVVNVQILLNVNVVRNGQLLFLFIDIVHCKHLLYLLVISQLYYYSYLIER